MRTLLTTLHSKYVHASLALPCLAAYCTEACGELQIGEFTVHEPKESLLAQILSCEPQVIAFSVYLWNRTLSFELAACLKQVNPQLRVVLGGPEVSFEPEDFFDHYDVDALICGEGEIPMRHLLSHWQQGQEPPAIAGLRTRLHPQNNGQSRLESLDLIPSPIAAELVDLQRGLVYFESSRGCPYECSFCMSALDERVRFFSTERVFADLNLLMKAEVPQVKFVDRTFNVDSQRCRDIFRFILRENRSSRFHFEIGAHLLDTATMELLEQVPQGMFQFEVGVQSTLPATLEQIGRKASLERLAENVKRLRAGGNIHLHLDLIAGLPGESYTDCLQSLDWTVALEPHHLQLETVKLLPGSPLRLEAQDLGLSYDPAPPYTLLRSADMSYFDLERLRGLGRLLDLLCNSGRFSHLLARLVEEAGSLATCLEELDQFWREENLYHGQRSYRALCQLLARYCDQRFSLPQSRVCREALAWDYACQERVVSGSAPDFMPVGLSAEEHQRVKRKVRDRVARLERSGKVQYFAAPFEHLPEQPGRQVLIFLYFSKSGEEQQVLEMFL